MPQALQRFEQAPERPPDKVIRQLNGHVPAVWQAAQVGYAGHFRTVAELIERLP